jgi:aspartyl-tRNA(Asn)/glutamyl-tRNA(Gln) amidotransferase subunit A
MKLSDPIRALVAQVVSGEQSAASLVAAAFDNIAVHNDSLIAFVHTDRLGAEHSANLIDTAIAEGRDVGPLAGVPFGVKDLHDAFGQPTRYGSELYRNAEEATTDSEIVKRLRGAGAIPIGKTATPEMGLDSSTTSPLHGVTRNPFDLSRTPGGSSGGSAAAVASAMVPFATASDGGGSTRAPAAFTSLVGHKPSHGLIPRSRPHGFSVDGVLTRTVADTALLLDVVAGPSLQDRTSFLPPGRSFSHQIQHLDVDGVSLAYSDDFGYAVVDPEVADLARQAAQRLAQCLGTSLSMTPMVLPDARRCWLTMAFAELAHEVRVFDDDTISLLAPLTQELLRQARLVTLDDLMNAFAERDEIDGAFANAFTDQQIIMTPTVACEAYGAADPIPVYINGRDAGPSGVESMVMQANVCWFPALSVPAGFTQAGLPVGLQLMAPRHQDGLLLRLGHLLEQG